MIRGYIEKYNSPPVYNFVSVHGPLMGVSMVPQCSYSNSICKLFNKFLVSSLAYYGFAQNLLAQSNYFRDPTQLSRYTKFCKFLPALNNEADEESGMSKNRYDAYNGSSMLTLLLDALLFFLYQCTIFVFFVGRLLSDTVDHRQWSVSTLHIYVRVCLFLCT